MKKLFTPPFVILFLLMMPLNIFAQNPISSFVVSPLTLCGPNTATLTLSKNSSPTTVVTFSNNRFTYSTSNPNAIFSGNTLTYNWTAGQSQVTIDIDLQLKCSAFNTYNGSGSYQGYSGTYPLQQPITASIPNTNFSSLVNANVAFPNLSLQGHCNFTWDYVNNEFSRTLSVVNSGLPIDLNGNWEIKIFEKITGTIPTIYNYSINGINLPTSCYTIVGNLRIITLNNVNLNGIINPSGLTSGVSNNNNILGDIVGEKISILQKTTDCLNFSAKYYVGFNCNASLPNVHTVCVGNQPQDCQFNQSPDPVLEISQLTGQTICVSGDVRNNYTLVLSNTGVDPLQVYQIAFSNPQVDYTSDYTNFTFNTGLPINVSIGTFQTNSDYQLLQFQPITLNTNQSCTLTFEGDLVCPPIDCGNKYTDKSEVFATYSAGCGGASLQTINRYVYKTPGAQCGTDEYFAGDLFINAPQGPPVLAGVNGGTQPAYDIVFPITDPCLHFWPNISGFNDAYLLELNHCDFLTSSTGLNEVYFRHNNNWIPLSSLVPSQLGQPISFSSCASTIGGSIDRSFCVIPFGIYSYSFNNVSYNCTINQTFITTAHFKYQLRPVCGSGGPCDVTLKIFHLPYQFCGTSNLYSCGNIAVNCPILLGCVEIQRIVVCPGCVTAGMLNGLEVGVVRAPNSIAPGNIGLHDAAVLNAPAGDGFYENSNQEASTSNGAKLNYAMYGDILELDYHGEVNINFDASHDGGNYHPYISNPSFGNQLSNADGVSDVYKKGFKHAYVSIKVPPMQGIELFKALSPVNVLNSNTHFAEFVVNSEGVDYVFRFSTSDLGTHYFEYETYHEIRFDLSLAKWAFINTSTNPDVFTGTPVSTQSTAIPFVYNNNTTAHGKIYLKVDKNIGLSNDFVSERFFLIMANGYLGLKAEQQGVGSELNWLIKKDDIPNPPYNFLSTDPYYIPNSLYDPNLPIDPVNNPVNIQDGVMNDHLCEYFSNFSNPLYTNLQTPITFTSNGISHTLDGCDDLAWECQTSIGFVYVGGFDYEFPNLSESNGYSKTMLTCGVHIKAITTTDFSPHNGEQLFILRGLGTNANAFENGFPNEYRHWARRTRLDVEFQGVAPSCSINPIRVFYADKMIKTTRMGAALFNTYSFNPITSIPLVNNDCENGGATPNIVTDNNNNLLDNFNSVTQTCNALQACDDAFSWSSEQYYIAVPCATTCTDGEFCIRQEVDFHNAVNGNVLTTNNIAEGLEVANKLPIPSAPNPRNGVLDNNDNSKRFWQTTIDDITTVSPELAFSNATFSNPSFGVDGSIEWEIQIENRSFVADAPNPWLSIHLPTLTIGGITSQFWSNLSIELIDPIAPDALYPNLPSCSTTLGSFWNGIGAFSSPMSNTMVSGSCAPFQNMLTGNSSVNLPLTAIGSSSTDFYVKINMPSQPQALNGYDVFRRAYNDNNCSILRRSFARFKIKLHYDCERIEEVLAELNGTNASSFTQALRPKVWFGYACDDDLENSSVPLFNDLNVQTAQGMSTNSCGAINTEQHHCITSGDCNLNFNFMGTIVDVQSQPAHNSTLNPCGETLTFTYHNSGQENSQSLQSLSIAVANNTSPDVIALLPTNINQMTFTFNGQSFSPTNYTLTNNSNTWELLIDLTNTPLYPLQPNTLSGDVFTISFPFSSNCNSLVASNLQFLLDYDGCFADVEAQEISFNISALQALNAVYECSNKTVTASGGCGGYEWVITNGFGQSFKLVTGNQLDLSTLTVGTYNIILTDAAGCSFTLNNVVIDVSDEACCPNIARNFLYNPIGQNPSVFFPTFEFGTMGQSTNITDLFNLLNITPVSGVYNLNNFGWSSGQNMEFVLKGDIIINVNTNFNFCNFKFAAGASIKVLPGTKLEVNQCELKSCGEYLWKGIECITGTTSLNTSQLVLKNTFILDAFYGVQLSKIFNVQISGTTFYNCFIGVFYPIPNSVVSMNQYLSINKCNFKGYNPNETIDYYNYPIKKRYATAPVNSYHPNIVKHSYCGVYVVNLKGNFSFRNSHCLSLCNGILVMNTNTFVSSSSFRLQQPFNYIFSKFGQELIGNGIMAINTSPSTTIKGLNKSLYVNGTIAYSGNIMGNFENFKNITTVAYNTYVNGQSFIGLTANFSYRTGIKVIGAKSGNIEITKNDFHFLPQHIILTNNDPVNTLNVSNNYSYINYSIDQQMYPGLTIQVQEQNISPIQFAKVKNNNIVHAYGNWQLGAIYLNSCQSIEVSNNFMEWIGSFNTPSVFNSIFGLYTANCKKLLVNENKFKGVSSAFQHPLYGNYPSSIISLNTTASTFECNDMDKTKTGITFWGTSTDINLLSNLMRDHKTGLRINNNTTFSPQYNKGNLWLGNNYTPNMAAVNENSIVLASTQQFLTHTQSMPYFPPHTPQGWFQNLFGLTQPDLCDTYYEDLGDDNHFTMLDESIAEELITFEEYDDELRWQSEKNLLEKLMDNPDILDTSITADDFYDENENSNKYKFLEYQRENRSGYEYDSVLRYKISVFDSLLQLTGDSINIIDSLMNVDSLFEGIGSVILKELHYKYNDYFNYSDSLKSIGVQNYSLKDSMAKELLNGIAATDSLESDYKQYFDIYSSTIAKHIYEFSESQKEILWRLAFKCPLKGGEATLLARSAQSIYLDTVYNDCEICLAEGIAFKTDPEQTKVEVKPKLEFKIYPNPSTEVIKLEATDLFENADIKLVDVLGKTVLQVKKNLNVQSTSIAHSLSSGLYTVLIKRDGKIYYRKNISVVR